MLTPIVKVTLARKQQLIFYDEREYKEYERKNQGKKFKAKYYKGLGTSKDSEIKDTFGKKVIEYINDEGTTPAMEKAFGGKNQDLRKEWLKTYDPNGVGIRDDGNSVIKMPYSDFIDKELIKFSINDCARSIPNIMDGMKECQRKILYACFKRKLNYSSDKTLKVAQLGAYASECTNYHHGEQNLCGAIINMAQIFVGSNNIPLLYRDGQFGSSISNGKDAASPRYVFTKLEKLTRLLFRSEDDRLLDYLVDEGDIIEPRFYVPILPIVLVNGCEGIGTGWSTNIPSYNPLDLVKCVKLWLENEGEIWLDDGNSKISLLPDISPWYRGFTGEIKKNGGYSYMSYGRCERLSKDKVKICEIPVGMSIDKCKEKVEKFLESKLIEGFELHSTKYKVDINVKEGRNGIIVSTKSLKLQSTINTSNLVLFTEEEKLNKYNTVDEIIDTFCKVRLTYYYKRKEVTIRELERELLILQNKHRFLKEVINDELVVYKKEEDVLVEELKKKGYNKNNKQDEEQDDEQENKQHGYDYLLRMPIRSFTKDKMNGLFNKIKDIKRSIIEIKGVTEKDQWLQDLDEFVVEYEKWLILIEKEMDQKNKGKRKIK